MFTEILGDVLGVFHGINTFLIYNIWSIVSFYFYMFFFLSLLKITKRRNIVKFLISSYSLYTFFELCFVSDFLNKSLDLNTIIGSLLLVIVVLIYFSELLQDDALLNLKETIFFWIGMGVLLFNIGFIPVFVIAEYISFGGVFRIITLVLNLLMASCFITGFIVSKKENNSKLNV